MNRFKKILTLALTLAVLITAFVVVASASSDGSGVVKQSATLATYSYTDKEVGYAYEPQPGGYGTFVVANSENGNNWVKHTYTDYDKNAESVNKNSNYLGGPYKGNSKYSFTEYPYCAIDFDIMMAAGSDYAGLGVNAIYYGYGAVTNDLGEVTSTLNGSQISSTTVNISAFRSALPSELNKWSHVTVIYYYNVIDGVDYISSYVYVNGNPVYQNAKQHKITATYSSDLYYFGTFRFNNANPMTDANSSGYDNLAFNFYNAGYSLEEIASAVYTDKYELPYGTTVAILNDEVYDNVNKAIEIAKNGDIIRLVADVTSPLTIDKTIILDINKYDENGNATGELYSVEYGSNSLVAFENDPTPGFISFKELQNSSVQVFWDDCPGIYEDGVCTCPDEFSEHAMSAFTESAMLNTTPSYPGEIPTFPIVDGVSKKFVGWSYTQGGEVEELRAVTQEDIDEGYILLYPVYEPLYYALEVTSGDEVKYFLEEDAQAAFATAPDGAIVKLIRDIEITKAIEITSSVTVDFNGYDVMAYSVVKKTHQAVLDDKNAYVAGELISSEGTALTNLFYMTGRTDKTLIFKSSIAGTDIYTLTVNATILMLDGEVYKTTIANNEGSFLTINGNCSDSEYYFYGDGISVYASSLLYNENHNNDNKNTLLVDGGTFYNVVSNYRHFLHWTVGGTVELKNATFIGNGDGFFRDAAASYTKPALNLLIDNCDIVNCDIRFDNPNSKATITNTRLYMPKWIGTYGGTIGEGTYTTADLTASKGSLADGLEQIAASKKFTYTVCSSIARDPETFKPIGAAPTTELEVEFKYYAVDPVNGIANVIWKDHLGNVLATSKAVKNQQASAPAVEVPVGDGYRAVTNISTWLDAEGNISDLTLGNASEYVFTAVLPDEADRKYVAYLDGAMANLVYYAHFGINIYLPKVDGITIVKMGNSTSFGTVLIDGKEYYVSKMYINTNKGLEASNMWVTYNDGTKEYSVNVQTSIMWYANAIVNDPASSAAEKEAMGCLVRFIEETYKAVSTTTDAEGNPTLTTEQQAKLDEFYAVYTPADYVTEYLPEELHTVNDAALDGLVESIHFTVLANGKAGLAVTLTDEAYAAGYKVSFSGIMYGTGYNSNGSKVYYTDNVFLHNYIMTPRYSITVIDSNDATVEREINGEMVKATTNYSLATYCDATDSDLAKALYALGRAVIAVRATLY